MVFAIQEAGLAVTSGEEIADVIDAIVETLPAEAYLHLMELTTEHTLKPAYDVGNEFEIGFNLF